MNRIEMYASSSDLRNGLHRVLATSHALTTSLEPDIQVAWWDELDDRLKSAACRHELSLEDLAGVYTTESCAANVDGAREMLGLEALDSGEVEAAFRRAIINARAHRDHRGRDVYGLTNKRLWDMICGPFGKAIARRFGAELGEAPYRGGAVESSALLDQMVQFDTTPKGTHHDVCVSWLRERLVDLGFEVVIAGRELGRPLLVARRAGTTPGRVVLYGHYDVTAFGRDARWTHPARQLTLADGRFFGRGVADNKGALACRLHALASMTETPELYWIIQGEEEVGSPVGHALLPDIMAEIDADLWLEETGYVVQEDGALLLIARTVGANDTSRPPDEHLTMLARGLRALASRWGVGSRLEIRGLNKNLVLGGCPFNRNLPAGARYLAIGVNDSRASIHAYDESVPTWTFAHHRAQLDVVFRHVAHLAGGDL